MPLSIKFALRQLLKTPGFTLTALATLAICLAANLTIFAVVDAVVVRSLPFPDSERLVVLYNTYPGAGVPRSSSSVPNYYDRRKAIAAFSEVAVYQPNSTSVGDGTTPTRVEILNVSPEFFDILGVKLLQGKSFTDDQLIYGPDAVAVLTAEYWRDHFNSDPNILGKTFLNDGLPVTVIGITPAHFRFLSTHAQFFRPTAHSKDQEAPTNRHSNNYEMIAKLAPGVTLAGAQAQMDAFNAVQLKDDPYATLVKSVGYRTVVRGLHADHIHEVRPMLLLLQCGVVSLLLIGAVNLANLFLIRASGRTKELAVRQALGARRRHIAMGVLTETTLLAVVGGALGVVLGALGIRLIHLLGTDTLPLGSTITFDARVAAAAFGAAVIIGVLLAVPTIWLCLHTKLASGLAAESRSGTSGHGAQRVRHAFIVVQVALAFVLLSGAGLLTVSLKHVLETPPGFNPENVATGQIALPWNTYKSNPPRQAFVVRLLAELRGLPGVTHAAITTGLPFSGNTNDSAVLIEGENVTAGASVRAHFIISASPDYWAAMGIPLLRGRLLRDGDSDGKTRVCVVDDAFANRYWPGGDPLGKRLEQNVTWDKDKAYTIVGVVKAVKQDQLAELGGHGAVYLPYPDENQSSSDFSLVVASTVPFESLAPMVRRTLAAVDASLPLDHFQPMGNRIEATLVTRRSPAILAGVFALVALLLASIGTYGVLSYAVSQRQREIGVRMALGALPSQVRNQFLSIGIRLVAAGIAIGIGGAWLTGRAIQSLLFNVPAVEGVTLGVTVLVMAVVALAASLLPAARAARVDPVVALRGD